MPYAALVRGLRQREARTGAMMNDWEFTISNGKLCYLDADEK